MQINRVWKEVSFAGIELRSPQTKFMKRTLYHWANLHYPCSFLTAFATKSKCHLCQKLKIPEFLCFQFSCFAFSNQQHFFGRLFYSVDPTPLCVRRKIIVERSEMLTMLGYTKTTISGISSFTNFTGWWGLWRTVLRLGFNIQIDTHVMGGWLQAVLRLGSNIHTDTPLNYLG